MTVSSLALDTCRGMGAAPPMDQAPGPIPRNHATTGATTKKNNKAATANRSSLRRYCLRRSGSVSVALGSVPHHGFRGSSTQLPAIPIGKITRSAHHQSHPSSTVVRTPIANTTIRSRPAQIYARVRSPIGAVMSASLPPEAGPRAGRRPRRRVGPGFPTASASDAFVVAAAWHRRGAGVRLAMVPGHAPSPRRRRGPHGTSGPRGHA
jgi:hypothetical protein